MSDSWSGFHRLPRAERLQRVAQERALSPQEVGRLCQVSALPHTLSETFIENALGSFPLPLGLAVHFVVDQVATVVPMAVEESSVVAAASNGARMAAQGGGFVTEVPEPIAIGQVELRDTSLPRVQAILKKRRKAWMTLLDDTMPTMVARGGGMRDITARSVGKKRVVLHLHVDTRDAMGANLVNTLAETLGPLAAKETGARLGLRILSNLATTRVVTARCRIPVEAVGGVDVARAIVEANAWALADPYRAATHNKGILNGIDPVLIATGNDWRAVAAGAHAYAASKGTYRALTTYAVKGGHLEATLRLPLMLGTVGGVTRLHPVAQVALKVLGSPDATRLAGIVASVGLAQNLAALRALSAEGIQAGHMRLHEANRQLGRASAAPSSK